MTRTSLVGPLVTRGPGSAGGARRPIYGSGIRDGRPGMPDETEGGTRAANPAMPMRCLGDGPGTCPALPGIGRGLSDIADMLQESRADRDLGPGGTRPARLCH